MSSIYSNFIDAFPISAIHHILEEGPSNLLYKSGTELVTNVDLELEELLIGFIRTFFPASAIQSEESNSEFPTADRQSDYWLLDPLDGTHNYSFGMPYYGIQLCHLRDGKACFALIYLPQLRELYSFAEDLGAATFRYEPGSGLRQKKEVPALNIKAHSYYSFGDFSNSNRPSRMLQGQLMTKLSQHVSKIRIHGASSVDFAFLCASRSQAHFVFSNRPWELFPGIALAKAYGMLFRTYELDTAFYKGQLHVIGPTEELNFIEEILDL